ncbi:FAD-dependent oxidoreductase [Aspergillus undulatus]|uniref:FAD-dependent oxidoreductase n=1 Tax=Aspergillus undulatus TaxID=1810928 RepID=UPI003CCDDC8F
MASPNTSTNTNGSTNGGTDTNASANSNSNWTTTEPLTVAIIGSGIIGTVLALGLASRNIPVKIYEQSGSHRTIGAGIAFTANARECLSRIDPRLEECVTRVATVNGDPGDPNHCMQFVDGYSHDPTLNRGVGSEMGGRKVYRLHAGKRGFEGCHRAEFLGDVLGILPEGVVEWGRRVERYVLPEEDGDGRDEGGKVKLVFYDGGTAEADVVIGCDGIKSRIRQLLFRDTPISNPSYTHKIAFRGLIPMALAISTLGKYRATNQHMYGGPGAHVLHFPVAGQKLMNVVAFVHDPAEWPLSRNMTQPASASELKGAFEKWGPTVRAIIELLTVSEGLDKWAVFDHFEYPAPYYAPPLGETGAGRVCIAGDAAHASSPHHGAGAGIGVEDALALCTALEKARDEIGSGVRGKKEALSAALGAYSNVRLERSQWLVRSSREVCGTYEWVNPEIGPDLERGFEDVKERSHKIWYFDIDGMLGEVEEGYCRLVEAV